MLSSFLADQKENSIAWAAVVLAVGIAVYFSLPFEPGLTVPLFASVAFIAAAIIIRIPLIRTALIIGFLFSLGITAGVYRTSSLGTVLLQKEIRYTPLTGTVETLEKRPGGLRLVIRPDSIERLKKSHSMPSRLQVTTRHMKDVVWEDLPGSRVMLTASLIAPSPPVIPGAYDFGRHAYFEGVGGYGYTVGKSEIIEQSDSGYAVLPKIRAKLTQKVFDAMPKEEGGIAATLLTGSRSGVTDKAYDAFKAAGLAHLLSISGMHVGMVAGFLFYVSRLIMACFPILALRYPIKKWAAGFALAGALLYTLMVGAPIPTQRAFLMTSVALLAIMVDRSPLSMRLVAVAALLLLILQPESLLGPSFQMSFAAVVALVAFYDVTRSFWQKQWREGGRHFHKRLLIYLYGVLATTIVATLATSLFAVFHFGQLAPYSIPGNLVAMPIMAVVIMPSVVLTYFLAPLGLEFISLWLIEKGLAAILFISYQIDTIPQSLYPLPMMPMSVLLLFVAGGVALCLVKGRMRLAGLLPIVIGTVLYTLTPLPDVIVTHKMGLFGVWQNDHMVVVEEKNDSFTRGLVTAMVAENAQRIRTSHDKRCDSWGCVFDVKGKKVAIALKGEAIAEDCARADILISREAVEQKCQAHVIDWWDIYHGGGMALFFDKTGQPKITYVNDIRHDRPWVQ